MDSRANQELLAARLAAGVLLVLQYGCAASRFMYAEPPLSDSVAALYVEKIPERNIFVEAVNGRESELNEVAQSAGRSDNHGESTRSLKKIRLFAGLNRLSVSSTCKEKAVSGKSIAAKIVNIVMPPDVYTGSGCLFLRVESGHHYELTATGNLERVDFFVTDMEDGQLRSQHLGNTMSIVRDVPAFILTPSAPLPEVPQYIPASLYFR